MAPLSSVSLASCLLLVAVAALLIDAKGSRRQVASTGDLGWWWFRGDSPCAGEFEQCPQGDCVLLSEYCGSCPRGQYVCPPATNGSTSAVPNCAADFADCPGLAGTFWDTSLSIDARADALADATTTNEQIMQLQNQAPSIPRLYVPRYQWLNDDLHGLRGNWTTSFPNGNALGASFAHDTLRTVGRIIAEEARAVHHFYTSRGRRGQGWVNGIGLTAYAPNINLVRDPRWGRAQEVYGEDPFLTGSLSESYVRGMQNATESDTAYWSAAACCKHFAAYDLESFPVQRYYYNAIVNGRDMYESYFPAFESCAARANAGHVMCSYNAINGVPTCAEPRLLNTVLRNKWNFSGFVVSDYDAWANIYSTHAYCPNMTCAAATGLNAGMDQEGGGDAAILQLPQALADGWVTKDRIRQAFKRLFRARFRLGMFDSPNRVPMSNLSASVVASTKHISAALQAGRDAMCLYKNDNNALPLRTTAPLVVVGPKVTATRWLQGNYATPPISGIVSIGEALMNAFCPAPALPDSQSDVLYATDLAVGNPVVYPSTPAANLSHCRAQCNADIACNYVTFYADTGDCVKLPVDTYMTPAGNQSVMSAPRSGLVINAYDTSYQSPNDLSVPAQDARQCAQRCRNSRLCALWTFNSGLGTCVLLPAGPGGAMYAPGFVSGASPSKCTEENGISLVDGCSDGLQCNMPYGFTEAVEKAERASAVVYVFGLDQNMESEGNDRETILLPDNQYVLATLLADAVAQGGNGAPLIGVMVHGGTIALNLSSFDALLDAWYPGAQGGQAVSDALLGVIYPAGRAAVTYYSSDAELPPNLEQQSFYPDSSTGYKGLTYRYYQGAPVIPFGHGLSYTTFNYSSATAPSSVGACDTITVTVDVTNTGGLVGDEVVQVYVQQPNSSVPAPQVRLAGFKRVRNLAKGATVTVSIDIEPRFRAVVLPDQTDAYASTQWIDSGTILVSIGNGQPAYGTQVTTLPVMISSSSDLANC